MTSPQTPDKDPASDPSLLGKLDAWMAENPWHPRATPFFVYMIGMLVIMMITGGSFGLPELTFIRPAIYTVQIGLVVFLLVRYRKLLPELNIKFHWLAVPTGIGLLFAWIYLGYFTIGLSRAVQDIPVLNSIATYLVDPTLPMSPAEARAQLEQGDAGSMWIRDNRPSLGDAWYWTTMSLRFIGMALVVPLFEELWVRSAVMRGMFDPRKTWQAILQLSADLPVIGEPISRTKAGQKAMALPPMFTEQLEQHRIGQISLFAVISSTVIFTLAHQQRDYLGCIACGIVWCWLVWYTNKPKKGETWADQPPGGRYGIGPIAWSHGITNAALWYWTIQTNDWQFL